MTSRWPSLDALLASVATGSVVTLYLLPPTPYLVPVLWPWTLGLSVAWALWCLRRLDQALWQWHRWHVSPAWIVDPATLRPGPAVLFGRGFRWQAPHVEIIARALLQDGGLPEGAAPRGGYPAIHAVGVAQEDAIALPWLHLNTHVGLVGTTRSGKSRELEYLLTQAIGA